MRRSSQYIQYPRLGPLPRRALLVASPAHGAGGAVGDARLGVRAALAAGTPAAGGGRAARAGGRLRDVLAGALPAEHAETRGPGDGERLAREAAAAGAPLVVAVGGDGTLNEVVNGVRTAGRGAPVGAVLTGRGCDAPRNFGVPRHPIAAVRALADGVFDVVVLGALGRVELLRWLPTIYPGTHLRNPRVTVRRARQVRVSAPTPLPTHVDGEPVGATPVVFTLEPGALRLRVPRGA